MKMYKDLTVEEEEEFREWARTDDRVQCFMRHIRCFHPTVKDEIIKQIQEGAI